VEGKGDPVDPIGDVDVAVVAVVRRHHPHGPAISDEEEAAVVYRRWPGYPAKGF
jgi:hypothetical protein